MVLRTYLCDNRHVGKLPAALGMAAAVATLAVASPARAQGDDVPPAEPATRGFGERGSFLLGLENVFGVLDQTYTGAGGSSPTSVNDNGFFPQYLVGTRLSLHGLMSSGLTLGGIVGVWGVSGTGPSNGSVTAFNVGPRIGWAGCFKKVKQLGFWGRTGPTFQYVTISESLTVNGQPVSTPSIDSWAFDWSFEAFLVWSPVDHFGLLAGPSVDVGLAGHQSQGNQSSDWGYHSIGMSFGLVFEL